MSLHTRLNLLLIALTAASVVLLANFLELSFPTADLVTPCLIVGGLGLFAEFYRRKQNKQFVAILSTLMQVVAYTMSFTTLMYAVAAIGRPFVDESLIAFDAACGVYLPAIFAWSGRHPTMARLLAAAYDTMLLQTAAVIAVLGFANQLRELQGFVRQFMLSSLLVMVVFALWPAAGPIWAFGYDAHPAHGRYLDHLFALRSGARTLISWRDAEGMVTVPSFHTTWAILLAFALRRYRWLFVPSVVLNLAVIVSTLTIGSHYFADVVAGIAVAAAAIAVSYALEAWFARVEFAERALATNTSESQPQPISIPLWRPKLVRSDS